MENKKGCIPYLALWSKTLESLLQQEYDVVSLRCPHPLLPHHDPADFPDKPTNLINLLVLVLNLFLNNRQTYVFVSLFRSNVIPNEIFHFKEFNADKVLKMLRPKSNPFESMFLLE